MAKDWQRIAEGQLEEIKRLRRQNKELKTQMESRLTQVSLLAGRAADYLREDNKPAYTEIEKQCKERFPDFYPETFYLLVKANLKPLNEVGEQDLYQFPYGKK